MGSPEKSLTELRKVIDALLGPDGCPWDRQQTPESLCDYIIEEGFELVEAIRSGDREEAREELGDVLFLLIFAATLYERAGDFDLAQALDGSAEKMIRRHPHVFGDKNFKDRKALMDNWERTKKEEKSDKSEEKKRAFASLPKGLPPLLRAYRINSKAARLGFTWETDEEVERQLESEWREWRETLSGNDLEAQEEEFGDYLFTLVELGRRKGYKANSALAGANRKFLERFEIMEDLARERGLDMGEMEMEGLNALWDEAKKAPS